MSYETQFAALSHPLRQQILNKLSDGDASVRQLTDILPASQPVISQHLKVLKEAGLVSASAVGMKNIYRIEPEGLKELRAFLEQHWLTALSGLGKGDGGDD